MALGCELSPLVLSTLYERVLSLKSDNSLVAFSDRAAQLGLDDDWFRSAIDAYRRMAELDYPDVHTNHSLLATWLLAGERRNAKLQSAELDAEFAALPTTDADHQAVLRCWTLGKVALAPDQWGPRALAVPACPPADPNVAAAYEGLIRHATALADHGEFGEMAHTAVVFRLHTLVEGILPGTDSPEARFRERLANVRGILTPNEADTWRASAEHLYHPRNVMTHLHQGKSPSSFSDYASDYDAVQSVRAPALACALLVFDQVSVEQSEATGPGVIAAVERDIDMV